MPSNVSCVGRQCTGCCACASLCPVDAISIISDDEGFLIPDVNEDACIGCGLCLEKCHTVIDVDRHEIKEMYAAINKDAVLRAGSSSGGAFSGFAECVLTDGGVVFGASIDQNGHVAHKSATSKIELDSLQKSKYVQSDTRGVFEQVKNDLLNKKTVLFSGCPCQVAGLKSFLGEDSDRLVTVDLICHGTPSPKLWEDHVASVTGGLPASHISFRRKDIAARTTFAVDISAPGVRKKGKDEFDDPYMALFVTGSVNRECCYGCKYANSSRVADITIGDCASSDCYPQFYPWQQLSSISINTMKGMDFWNKVRCNFEFIPIDIKREISLNAQLNHPSARPKVRDEIYRSIAKNGLEDSAKFLTDKRGFKQDIKYCVKHLIPNSIRGGLKYMKAKLHG